MPAPCTPPRYCAVDLSHFRMHQVIGKGGFGMVRIVEEKKSKQQFALKYINKRQCIKKHSVENIFRERLILQELNHPYIVNLQFAFQDDEYMFMGLDLALGGDVRFHLLRQGGLSEQTVRVYMAEIAQALGYIHKHQIIHRDLKPENLLIDQEGHVRITDFNVAYWVKDKLPSSRSGTLNYMSPETLSGRRYSYAVDWWALGVTMYEAFYGIKPFGGEDDHAISSCIRHKELEFPTGKEKGLRNPSKPDASPVLKDILYRFMIKDKDTRLGSQPNAFDDVISKEEFFANIDWQLISERKILPEYIPDMTKNNFEAAPALEELLYDSAPLTPKKRKKKVRGVNDSLPQLSRDSLSASLSASLNASPLRGELSASGTSPTDGSSAKPKDMSKMSDKEKSKERERRELQFIEDHFTIFVQGTGIGVLDCNKVKVDLCADDEGNRNSTTAGGTPRSASTSLLSSIDTSPVRPGSASSLRPLSSLGNGERKSAQPPSPSSNVVAPFPPPPQASNGPAAPGGVLQLPLQARLQKDRHRTSSLNSLSSFLKGGSPSDSPSAARRPRAESSAIKNPIS
ncbi:kinase-like domain-containing protein [Entophlyctis helioformis]|nr:kinase-like domain-containing protein [Entophlyctis helioformis]